MQTCKTHIYMLDKYYMHDSVFDTNLHANYIKYSIILKDLVPAG